MPDRPPSNLPDVDAYRQWRPEAQQRALSMLRDAENNQWRPFYCPKRGCNGQPHVAVHEVRECPGMFGHEWVSAGTSWMCQVCEVTGTLIDEWDFRHARQDQRPPSWREDWLTLLLRGGRGSGKTRTGAEITNRVTEITGRIILIGSTGPDLRDTMVEGESGILACSAPGKRPLWEPSKKRLTWPNGCIAQGFSAEEPDRLRGPQSGYVWADEPGHWALVKEVWDNMLFGLRLPGKRGFQPKIVATSTPKPTQWMKDLINADDTVDRVVSTYANIANLASTYRRTVLSRYEGTRLGKQELYGELLEDVEGALWNWGMINWIPEAPPISRKVVAVDPAGTANKKSDETGIVTTGLGVDKKVYVLRDDTGKFSPAGWARAAFDAYEEESADAIVYEKNYGGEMVEAVLQQEAKRRGLTMVRLIPVTSRRGKEIRAEPIVSLYEKAQVFHVGERGDLAKLEEEQTSWVPGISPSPNRVDALVHGITELAKNVMPAAISNPDELLRTRFTRTGTALRAV